MEAESTLARYEEAEQQVQAQLQQQAAQVQSFLEGAQQTLLEDMQSINWDQLREQNPGEWAAKREAFRQKAERLNEIHRNAAESFQKQQAEVREQMGRKMEERLAREQRQLIRAIPEWKDEAVAKAERSALIEYMSEVGYSHDEINAAYDHRAVVLAHKAMKYDQLKKNGDVAKHKVVKLAKKIVKPGQRQTEKQASANREQELVRAHRKNPKDMNAAAARIRMRMN